MSRPMLYACGLLTQAVAFQPLIPLRTLPCGLLTQAFQPLLPQRTPTARRFEGGTRWGGERERESVIYMKLLLTGCVTDWVRFFVRKRHLYSCVGTSCLSLRTRMGRSPTHHFRSAPPQCCRFVIAGRHLFPCKTLSNVTHTLPGCSGCSWTRRCSLGSSREWRWERPGRASKKLRPFGISQRAE